MTHTHFEYRSKQRVLASLIAFYLMASFALNACQAATPAPTPTPATISLTDGLGRQVDLPGPAQRVVSLGPSNTEILFAIGAGAQVVGRDSFSDYPAAAQALSDVGGGFGELNTEAIVALKPDLVLVADIFPAEQIKALEDLGLTVYALPNPTDFEGMYKNLETAARLTAHETQAADLIKSLKARVDAVGQKIATGTERPLVFYELDSTDQNAPYTAGPGTFVDTLINAAGGVNLGSKLNGSWVQVSIEELIVQDPAIIVLGDYTWGGVTPEMVKARPGWETLSAVKNGQVFTFDDNLVSRPGPRLVDGLEALSKLLHPDLFK
jgi:iron complex transport system substrate-binding protein